MALEDSDFELTLQTAMDDEDLFALAAAGVSSSRVNVRWAVMRAAVIAALTFADLPGVAASVHEHEISEVADLQDALDAKLDAASGTIATSQVTGLDAALALLAASDHDHAYETLTGLSTDVMEALGAADYAELRSLQSLGDLALISWGDTMADDAQTTDYFVAARSGSAGSPVTVTGSQLAAMVLAEATIESIDGLAAALAAKEANDSEIAQSRITNLTADLAAKLDAEAEIPQSQVADLVADLAGKLGVSDAIPQSQVTDLAATLAALTIPIAQISDAGTGTGGGAAVLAAADAAAIHVLLGLGTMAFAATGDYLASDADVEVADIAGLQDLLDAKLNVANPEPTGQFLADLGGPAAPSYSWASYDSTGFYPLGASRVGLSIAGTKRAEFNNYGLTVGSNLPSESDILTGALNVVAKYLDDVAPQLNIYSWNSSAPEINLAKSRSATAGLYTTVQSGDVLGAIYAWGSNDSNTYAATAVKSVAAADWSSARSAYVSIETILAGTRAERVRVAADGTLTMYSGPIVTYAPTTSTAGLNLPHGTAPTSPTNGDVWTTTGGVFARINSATKEIGLHRTDPGRYTPTLANVSNVASTSAAECHYSRMGDQVTVIGLATITPSGAGTTEFSVTLPVASTLGATTDATGISSCVVSGSAGGYVTAVVAGGVKVTFRAASTSAHVVAFTFSYRIV